MRDSSFSLQQIANVTKHKNLDSLKHYLSGPSMEEKQSNNEGLYNYGKKEKEKTAPKRKINKSEDEPQVKNSTINEENIYDSPQSHENREIAVRPDGIPQSQTGIDITRMVNNQLRQAPNLFQNATFSNCNFTKIKTVFYNDFYVYNNKNLLLTFCLVLHTECKKLILTQTAKYGYDDFQLPTMADA